MWLMTKRLEQGASYWPRAAEDGQTKLDLETFHIPTDGIDMHDAKPRSWYECVR